MSPSRLFAAEFLGTALLLTVVVGSGIMGDRLSGGNVALALLANTIATGAGLVVLIQIFAPLSGAHFNPAVTLAMWMERQITPHIATLYLFAQIAGAVIGVWVAHLMFGEPMLQISTKARDGLSQGFSEFVATFGLLLTIIGISRTKPEFVPVAVGLYITSAYWFTASTSFANPAVTLARSLTNTFAGIAPASVPLFIAAQILGTLFAVTLCRWLFKTEGEKA